MQITMGGKTYDVRWIDRLDFALKHLSRLNIKPHWITFDTESSGLHLIKDRAFLGAVAWHTDTERVVYVFPAAGPDKQAPSSHWAHLISMSKLVYAVYAHNTVYDMHMYENEVGEGAARSIKNWADLMGLLRVSFDAVSPRDGGDKLALKIVARKYIDPDADQYELEVKSWLKEKEKANRKILRAFLSPEGWTLKEFDAALKKGIDTLPPEIREIYTDWREAYPVPNYREVPMEIMIPYVATDVILTDLGVEMSVPVVSMRNQWGVMDREWRNLPWTFKMTRRGFRIDREYLKYCDPRLAAYIKKLQAKMHELAGRVFTVGQDEVIKDIYEERTGKRPPSTDKKFLKKMSDEGDELAGIIKKLRSLEKWKSTYVDNMLRGSEYNGRLHVGLNQFGTVSGRHSGDFQQMPKDPLLTMEGDLQKKANGGKWEPGENGCDPDQELFYPRKAVVCDEGSKLFYLDFSQEELRFQAHHTLALGGDINLCRAYMPFQCVHYETGETFDYISAEGRDRWKECREGTPAGYWEDILKAGHSAWVVPETGEYWVPTDVHGSTAREALKMMGMDPDSIDPKVFKYWRGIGKTYNFMKTYGGGPAKSADVLDITFEQCKAIDDGFITSFPVIPKYQQAIVNGVRRRGYIQNMYGRRYYITDISKAYKLANYNIQGPCADDLKEKIDRISKWLEENNCRSQILMPIHDEICYEVYDDEHWIVPHLCDMMMDTPKLLIPMVVEPDFTSTSWADKEAYQIA